MATSSLCADEASLIMNDYHLAQLRASPAIVRNPSSNLMASYPDFDIGYGQVQPYHTNYDGIQPKSDIASTNRVASMESTSEESPTTAPLRAVSVGSSSKNLARDGLASETSSVVRDISEPSGPVTRSSGNEGPEQRLAPKQSGEDMLDTPLWSEMKTKAGKERKRLPLACIACRRKKIRCSGEKPACKHCVRSRIPCVYKVTTRKAAPRTDYMAMLDKRLKRMEDRVIRLISKDSLLLLANVGRSVVKPSLPGAAPKTPTRKRIAEEAFGHDLDEWSRTKGTEAAVPGLKATSKEADDSTLLSEGAESLPSKEIQQHLAEVYFDFVYGQSYPLLHKPSFMRKLAAAKVPPVLILAMCAIAARFSTHPQLRTEPCFLRGDEWAEKARDISLKRYDSPNLTILIVYLLLGLHEFGTCQGGRSWMFGGMAQRMAYALQLHRDLEYDPTVPGPEKKAFSPTDREIRRRTIWSCFLMDRFNSSGTERPIFVQEQWIEAQLPVKEHLYIHEVYAPTENLDGGVPDGIKPENGQWNNPRDNMGVMAHTIRAVGIWGKVIKYMNLGGRERELVPMWSPGSTYHQIIKEAKDFKASLPPMLVWSPENLKSHAVGRTSNSFVYLHIVWQQTMLFMHRFALPSTAGSRPPKDMPHEFLTKSARTALDAANQVSLLINEAMVHNVVAPFAGYSAFFASTVHVHGVFSKNLKLEAQSKKYLAHNVKYLTKMKRYWGMIHYMAEKLKDLYRQHADALTQGTNAPGENEKGAIFQYGDWFDRYPHGVSKMDYEDAAESKANEPGTDAVLGQKSDLQSVEEFFASLSPPSQAERLAKQPRKNKARSVSRADVPVANPTNIHQHNSQPKVTEPSPEPQHQTRQASLPPGHVSDTAMQMNYDVTPIFSQAQTQQSHQHHHQHTSPQQYISDFAAAQHLSQHPQHAPHPHHHAPLPLLNTNPTMIHHPSQSQTPTQQPGLSMSPFADFTPDFNSSLWNLDALGAMPGTGGVGNGFFDPMSTYFVPFNVEPPMMGDDGVFGAQVAPEGYGIDVNMGDGMMGMGRVGRGTNGME